MAVPSKVMVIVRRRQELPAVMVSSEAVEKSRSIQTPPDSVASKIGGPVPNTSSVTSEYEELVRNVFEVQPPPDVNPIGDDEYKVQVNQPNPQEQTSNTRPTSSQINVSAEEYLLQFVKVDELVHWATVVSSRSQEDGPTRWKWKHFHLCNHYCDTNSPTGKSMVTLANFTPNICSQPPVGLT
eukprot:scaffold4497_cov152-Skeletonema_marinoi.AAC.8